MLSAAPFTGVDASLSSVWYGKINHHNCVNHWYWNILPPWSLANCKNIALNYHLVQHISYGPRSFAVSGPMCWNSLPPQLKSTPLTLQQFCDRLKTVYCFSEPTRVRGRHDVVIRLRGHKSILQLVSAVSWTIELLNYSAPFMAHGPTITVNSIVQ